jgi:hypothetical protein
MLDNPPTAGKLQGYPDPEPSDHWPLIAADDLPADILLPRLCGVTKTSNKQWSACCPAHLDTNPSLSISETDDCKLLIYCHRGCDPADVMAAVGLNTTHLFASGYAVFKARKKKRKSLAFDRSRPAGVVIDPTVVDDSRVATFTAHARACHAEAIAGNCLGVLAEQLHLPVQALLDFGVGIRWSAGHPLWVFVERDDQGRVVGIVNRTNSGKKWCDTGSHRGLILPYCPPAVALSDPNSPLYIPEGHTDTIALHAVGCMAIGRPAANLSGLADKWLAAFLLSRPHLWQNRSVVVTGDNDFAGQRGAETTADKLAQILGKPVAYDFPPFSCKDMRDWITAGTFRPGWPFNKDDDLQDAQP